MYHILPLLITQCASESPDGAKQNILLTCSLRSSGDVENRLVHRHPVDAACGLGHQATTPSMTRAGVGGGADHQRTARFSESSELMTSSEIRRSGTDVDDDSDGSDGSSSTSGNSSDSDSAAATRRRLKKPGLTAIEIDNNQWNTDEQWNEQSLFVSLFDVHLEMSFNFFLFYGLRQQTAVF